MVVLALFRAGLEILPNSGNTYMGGHPVNEK